MAGIHERAVAAVMGPTCVAFVPLAEAGAGVAVVEILTESVRDLARAAASGDTADVIAVVSVVTLAAVVEHAAQRVPVVAGAAGRQPAECAPWLWREEELSRSRGFRRRCGVVAVVGECLFSEKLLLKNLPRLSGEAHGRRVIARCEVRGRAVIRC